MAHRLIPVTVWMQSLEVRIGVCPFMEMN
jgi:hypothetical protein